MSTRAMKNMARKWDAIIVGGGHNGLVAASYLAKAGKQVCVLERRHLIGGAAVTEEIIPGFQFSRASYVFSLFRPQIIKDLDLYNHGLTAKFSKVDAEMFPKYNAMLEELVEFFTPMLDEVPPDPKIAFDASKTLRQRLEAAYSLSQLGLRSISLGTELTTFVEFMTSPADKILNRWFESDILKATLATDAIIGAKVSPSTPGSAYVLFHHVMGELDGVKGSWGHVRGGMGSVSQAIASAATSFGASIFVDSPVAAINVSNGKAEGVTLKDGTVLESNVVLSGASPHVTFLDLMEKDQVPEDLYNHIDSSWNCESASTKINVALDRLPNFKCIPNTGNGTSAMPHHRGTIHFEDSMEQIERAFLDVQEGFTSKRPVIEMNLPTALDDSIAPEGKHVALLFVQYTPYEPKDGPWSEPGKKDKFADQVFSVIEQYAPGFKESIIGYDMLTPPDLEEIFALPRGNIFHGAMGLDQLLWLRPYGGYSNYRTPIDSLYLCGAGTHPGGGVMGAPGRNAAIVCLDDKKI